MERILLESSNLLKDPHQHSLQLVKLVLGHRGDPLDAQKSVKGYEISIIFFKKFSRKFEENWGLTVIKWHLVLLDQISVELLVIGRGLGNIVVGRHLEISIARSAERRRREEV